MIWITSRFSPHASGIGAPGEVNRGATMTPKPCPCVQRDAAVVAWSTPGTDTGRSSKRPVSARCVSPSGKPRPPNLDPLALLVAAGQIQIIAAVAVALARLVNPAARIWLPVPAAASLAVDQWDGNPRPKWRAGKRSAEEAAAAPLADQSCLAIFIGDTDVPIEARIGRCAAAQCADAEKGQGATGHRLHHAPAVSPGGNVSGQAIESVCIHRSFPSRLSGAGRSLSGVSPDSQFPRGFSLPRASPESPACLPSLAGEICPHHHC